MTASQRIDNHEDQPDPHSPEWTEESLVDALNTFRKNWPKMHKAIRSDIMLSEAAEEIFELSKLYEKLTKAGNEAVSKPTESETDKALLAKEAARIAALVVEKHNPTPTGEWTWQMVDKIIADAKSLNEYPSDRLAKEINAALAAVTSSRLAEALTAIDEHNSDPEIGYNCYQIKVGGVPR